MSPRTLGVFVNSIFPLDDSLIRLCPEVGHVSGPRKQTPRRGHLTLVSVGRGSRGVEGDSSRSGSTDDPVLSSLDRRGTLTPHTQDVRRVVGERYEDGPTGRPRTRVMSETKGWTHETRWTHEKVTGPS